MLSIPITRLLLLALVVCFGVGCSATQSMLFDPAVIEEPQTFKSYSLGKISTATVGEPFLVVQDGKIRKERHWVGILNSPDGWSEWKETVAPGFLRKELIYSGKSGTTIKIAYREFRGGLAAPAFFQDLTYDLSESNLIRFQNFSIEVIEATNNNVRYKALGD